MGQTLESQRYRHQLTFSSHTPPGSKPHRFVLVNRVAPVVLALLVPSSVMAQVRGKLPDRGVYQPPRIQANSLSAEGAAPRPARSLPEDRPLVERESGQLEVRHAAGLPTSDQAAGGPVVSDARLVDPRLGDTAARDPQIAESGLSLQPVTLPADPRFQRVSHQKAALIPPSPPVDLVRHDATCDGCDHCDPVGCDSIGCGVFGCGLCGGACDTIGCDSMGDCSDAWAPAWSRSSLSFNRDRWFGGIDYLMMWRRGDRLPALVTTDSSATPNQATAGELGQPNTVILVGDDRIMERMASGGRVTLGTWLDDHQCLSLVGRGWYGGRKRYRYDQDQSQTSILVRPFLNVSDGQLPAQDTQIIAFPARASGSVHVAAQSEAFGADVSLRQFLYADLGVTWDFLYGYQFLRLNEGLGIASTSTSLDDDFAPVGASLSVSDALNVSNEFHGGQIGLATHYRERCWSFSGLAKLGFGSLNRRAMRSGLTSTTVDNATATINQGLLVRNTNAGSFADSTFAWVPELDFSLGWHRFAGWDLTFGYHLLAISDALQPSGTIDPNLAVNLSEPPTGAQRPSDGLRYRTFYMQGIHFGLQRVF